MSIDTEYKGRRDGLLEVECWCHTITVLVTPEDIREGRTRSYGYPNCRPVPARREVA